MASCSILSEEILKEDDEAILSKKALSPGQVWKLQRSIHDTHMNLASLLMFTARRSGDHTKIACAMWWNRCGFGRRSSDRSAAELESRLSVTDGMQGRMPLLARHRRVFEACIPPERGSNTQHAKRHAALFKKPRWQLASLSGLTAFRDRCSGLALAKANAESGMEAAARG